MKKIILAIILQLTLSFYVSAQELTVKSFILAQNDLSAQTSPRKDNNDTNCALIKVQFVGNIDDVEGNVIKPWTRKSNETWVYMTQRSRQMQIKTKETLPLMINFADYGITSLESNRTYVLTILASGNSDFKNDVRDAVFYVNSVNEQGEVYSHGNGFYISPSGIGITNFHILEGAESAYITDIAGKKFNINKVIDYNVKADLVKFQVEAQNPTSYLKISSSLPSQGSQIVSYAMPEEYKKENSVKTGIVLKKIDMNDFGSVYQISTPVSEYESGAPIINTNGEVVGIATYGVSKIPSLHYAISSTQISKLSASRNLAILGIVRNTLETKEVKTALAYYYGGENYRAIKILDQVLAKSPQNSLALLYRGINKCEGDFDYDSGLQDLEKACKMANNSDYFYNMQYAKFIRIRILKNNNEGVVDKTLKENAIRLLKCEFFNIL